jgi:hypothetical protein
MRQRPFARIARQRQFDYVLGKGGCCRKRQAGKPKLPERGAPGQNVLQCRCAEICRPIAGHIAFPMH